MPTTSAIVVLGANGLLGHMVVRVLTAEGHDVVATTRTGQSRAPLPSRVRTVIFDPWSMDVDALLDATRPCCVVNAMVIGAAEMRPVTADRFPEALLVNAVFPRQLADAAAARGCAVIQPSTDGVFADSALARVESDAPDARTAYGLTKMLGESPGATTTTLRCSVIGPEVGRARSLLEWVRHQPRHAVITGFADQSWNGITSLHYARLIAGLVTGGVAPGILQHVVPADVVTKHELVTIIAREFGRSDLTVEPSGIRDGRRGVVLGTEEPAVNERLWRAAGYGGPPSIEQMIHEVAVADAEGLPSSPA